MRVRPQLVECRGLDAVASLELPGDLLRVGPGRLGEDAEHDQPDRPAFPGAAAADAGAEQRVTCWLEIPALSASASAESRCACTRASASADLGVLAVGDIGPGALARDDEAALLQLAIDGHRRHGRDPARLRQISHGWQARAGGQLPAGDAILDQPLQLYAEGNRKAPVERGGEIAEKRGSRHLF